ncbi:hypothetical protein HIM_07054 [Hirsutella minnesotensis 3608]|uniref:Centromere protein H C-terminal domain-containing protein n=1 Tax=Hirsutella minnesotensis 3608 TaxID=1043627 RepID=A0A0F7ZTQ0_9HYPO|nr:hypothetical protein HIM_07054 [Hirsutella minnesotensis 3608]
MSRDEAMADSHGDHAGALPLSPDEQRVLDLFDTLQRLRLEVSMMNALASHRAGEVCSFVGDVDGSDTTTGARGPVSASRTTLDDLVEARAKFKLRNDAVEAVMMANPILKAVHNGTDASPVERDLLAYVRQRDEAVISAAKQAGEEETLRSQLTSIQAETVRCSRKNQETAAMLCDLANTVKQRQTGNVDSVEAQGEIARLEAKVASRRRRWRVMKGVASGIIAGSGVDWANDQDLCDIVLDPEVEE